MVSLSVNGHHVKNDIVPPLHLIRFLYSLLFIFVVVII
ncbi:putative membrane protein [Escherichia coli DEC5B]|nr:putative membrane protein [Escherichia coli DEC5B]